MTAGDDFWDNLFLAVAFAAYVEQAAIEQGPPDPEATRQRAFRYYEEALAEKNGPRTLTAPSDCQTLTMPRKRAMIAS